VAQELAALSPQRSIPDEPAIPMFGRRQIHYFGLSPFARWSALLVRWEHEREDAAESCLSSYSTASPCPPREWTQLIVRFRGRPRREQIDGINAAINAHPYVSAIANWGNPAHWETPFEFFRHNGQCQDYAITKFLLLRELGVPDRAMRLVVLRDTRRQVDHAVLVVDVSGHELMLDNLAPRVVSANADPNYHAYYSVNESGWWLYLPNPLMPDAVDRQVASR
jgi:predicted transglutaminase-like cysteine proteinase